MSRISLYLILVMNGYSVEMIFSLFEICDCTGWFISFIHMIFLWVILHIYLHLFVCFDSYTILINSYSFIYWLGFSSLAISDSNCHSLFSVVPAFCARFVIIWKFECFRILTTGEVYSGDYPFSIVQFNSSR